MEAKQKVNATEKEIPKAGRNNERSAELAVRFGGSRRAACPTQQQADPLRHDLATKSSRHEVALLAEDVVDHGGKGLDVADDERAAALLDDTARASSPRPRVTASRWVLTRLASSAWVGAGKIIAHFCPGAASWARRSSSA